MPDPNLAQFITVCRKEVDGALERLVPRATAKPAALHRAMRHSLFAGGKRLRPALAIAAAEACGGSLASALPAACAVECIHTFSLIHDDLPCMDDDDLRRGVPTCHVVFGEAVALLAGDALQALAFEALASAKPTKRYATAAMVAELARASGSRELIGGQVHDLEGEAARSVGRSQLRAIHERKTAALLGASLRLGGMAADATPRQLDALTEFGRNLGLAFQVIDDILDVTATTEQLGKTAGKDERVEKSTYPAVLGLDGSRREASRLTRNATRALDPFGKRAGRLHEISAYLLDRDH